MTVDAEPISDAIKRLDVLTSGVNIFDDIQKLKDIKDFYKGRKVIVLDRVGVIADYDDPENKISPFANDAIRALQDNGYLVVVWSSDSKDAVKSSKSVFEKEFNLKRSNEILWLSGDNVQISKSGYSYEAGPRLDNLLKGGIINEETYKRYNGGDANENWGEAIYALERKPVFLMFPKDTLLIDDYEVRDIQTEFNHPVHADYYPCSQWSPESTNYFSVDFLKSSKII